MKCTCGHENEESAKFCASCGLELKAQDADIAKVVKTAVEQGQAEVNEKLKKVEAELEAIKATPVFSKAVNLNTKLGQTYKGYKLFGQGERFRDNMLKDKSLYPALTSDEGIENFNKFVIDVVLATAFKNQEAHQALTKATNNEGTPSAGGYAVPTIYEKELLKTIREVSFALKVCRTMTMSSLTHKFPKESSIVTVAWTEEQSTITESAPTFAQVDLTAKKLAGLTSGVTRELLQDSSFDITSMLVEQFTYAIAQELDNQVLNGTGSPFSGVLTAAAGYSVVMSLTNISSVSAIDFSLAMSKLTEADLAKATWIYSRIIQHYVRSLKDTTNQPIYQAIALGNPNPTVYGIPVIQSQKAPSTTGTSKAFVALGNFDALLIGNRLGNMSFDVDPYTNFATDMVRFRAITRWGFALLNNMKFVRIITGS